MSLPRSFPLRATQGKIFEIPVVGYGTWAADEKGWAKVAVLEALKAGYRHLDCAWMYGVDQEVGEAIKESGIPREELFITTKFWPHFGDPENVELCLDLCLEKLGLEYVDLFLAHWPYVSKPISRDALINATTGPGTSNEERGILTENGKVVVDWKHSPASISQQQDKEGSYVPTWQALQSLVTKGKTRTVGVSNFSIAQLKEILPYAQDIPISCNQVEVHPWLPQNELIAFCKEHDILVSCYSPLAGQKKGGDLLVDDERVKALAEKNGLGVGQLLQSWAVQRGTVPLAKSSNKERIKANLSVVKLSDEDFEAINALALPGDEGRTINPSEWGFKLFQN